MSKNIPAAKIKVMDGSVFLPEYLIKRTVALMNKEVDKIPVENTTERADFGLEFIILKITTGKKPVEVPKDKWHEFLEELPIKQYIDLQNKATDLMTLDKDSDKKK